MVAGSDLRTEEHFIEQELGRVRESYNPVTDSMAGVYAGIVDGEKKRNPTLENGGSTWWDLYTNKLIFWPSLHHWPTHPDNIYDTCNDASPHPYCKTAAGPEWVDNFRNFPLAQQARCPPGS
jgi:hypothetical protein